MTSNGWRGPGWRVFDADPGRTADARHWISHVVAAYGCRADPADAALAVSELFTNALTHGPAGGRVLVGYCLWPCGARIAVCDAGGLNRHPPGNVITGSTAIPQPCDPRTLTEGGRGLYVIGAISAQWDSFRTPRHQVVWCDLVQPFPAKGRDAWAWLIRVLSATPLAPPRGTTAAAPAGHVATRPGRCAAGRALALPARAGT